MAISAFLAASVLKSLASVLVLGETPHSKQRSLFRMGSNPPAMERLRTYIPGDRKDTGRGVTDLLYNLKCAFVCGYGDNTSPRRSIQHPLFYL